MILETIVTTQNVDGTTNVAAMGPHCEDADLATFELRPFQSSSTWKNLQRTGQGVMHITDDVMLFAEAATGMQLAPELILSESVSVHRLANSCRCYEFETTWQDASQQRAIVRCRTIKAHRVRDFAGFNRAKHAVIEACILATRVDFLPPAEIRRQFRDLEKHVVKTGGPQEREAFELLKRFLNQAISQSVTSGSTQSS